MSEQIVCDRCGTTVTPEQLEMGLLFGYTTWGDVRIHRADSHLCPACREDFRDVLEADDA